MRVAGIMSGTSLDGIDVAIADIQGSRISTAAFFTKPYPGAIRDAILGVSNTTTTTAAISRLHFLLGELYARAVRETCDRRGIPLESIDLIGSHGQTIYHEGELAKVFGHQVASTLQIGEASVIAERTGIPVVSDFRPRDMAAGGKGAPLVPYVDYLLFRDRRRGRIALNIGGIANLTAIPANGKPGQVIAFDTGPGNMVMDTLAREHTGGKQGYDRGGRIAARGKLNRALLRDLLADPYYAAPPPKTAGREQYGADFMARLKKSGLGAQDLMATAAVFTAASIAAAIDRFVQPRMQVDDLIVSGGGVHNPGIMSHLAGFLPDISVATSADYGINVDAKEALAFAMLAYQTWRRRPSNLPAATGARHPVILGKVTYC